MKRKLARSFRTRTGFLIRVTFLWSAGNYTRENSRQKSDSILPRDERCARVELRDVTGCCQRTFAHGQASAVLSLSPLLLFLFHPVGVLSTHVQTHSPCADTRASRKLDNLRASSWASIEIRGWARYGGNRMTRKQFRKEGYAFSCGVLSDKPGTNISIVNV